MNNAINKPAIAARSGVSRREFLRGLGTAAITAAALNAEGFAAGLAQSNAESVRGPGAQPVTLQINGERKTFTLEPRTTLLEALRLHAGLTGPKEGCERATCGACTVLLDGVPVNSCQMLAIEAEGTEITTIEGLSQGGSLTRLQQALVDEDGLQCGYCTPGVALTLTAFLRRNPHPTELEVRHACAGHVCRCGSYPGIFAAALRAAGAEPAARLTVLNAHDHGMA